jgi:hypothetical protein
MMLSEAASFRPRLVLPGWRLADESLDGQAWVHDRPALSLIWSVAREQDGRLWLHLSVASPDRLPTWTELVAAKEWIAGTHRYAYQVVPPRSRYVNQHPNCLHLFVPVEGDPPLPDFTNGGASL